MQGKTRKFFPGANTANGSQNFFEYIIPENVQRIFCLKGGPGVGKSSMMKKIVQEFVDRGYDVELHYCPSDPSSLDGLVIKKLGVVMLDGTAPHIVDPKDPGAIDEIVNFGDYWTLEELVDKKSEIVDCGKDISSSFQRAFKYLKAAEPIFYSVEGKHRDAMNFGKVNLLTEGLLETIFSQVGIKAEYKKPRHLFGSAISPVGLVDYTDSMLEEAKKVYYLKGEIGTGRTTLLKKVSDMAIQKGLSVEIYHYPLIPEKLETVYIKDLGIAVTTSPLFKDNETIDLVQYLDEEKLARYKEEVEYDKEFLTNLIEYAISNLNLAKTKHDVIENCYIPSMNFDKINELKDDIVKRILRYEE